MVFSKLLTSIFRKRIEDTIGSDKELSQLIKEGVEKTHILTMLYRSHLTIFSIDNQHEKGSKKNAMEWSTTAYFPISF